MTEFAITMQKSWTIQDIQALNPSESEGGPSFLNRLLELGATTEEQLIEFANLLESRGGPLVAAFGQLPFDLGLGEICLAAPGDRPNSEIELFIRPTSVHFDSLGRIVRPEPGRLQSGTNDVAGVTQLIAIVRLGDKRARVHPLYLSRLSHLGLLREPLGNHMVESWMRLPETTFVEPTRRRRPLSGIDFQRDVAARTRDHMVFATKALLHAFGVAALVDVRDNYFLYGYHAMIAPGRIASAGRPEPIIKGLVADRKLPVPKNTSLPDVRDYLTASRRSDNLFIQRLQALNSLLANKEPELALVGCVTALEWFLNERFPELCSRNKSGDVRTAQLSVFLKSKYSSILSKSDIDQISSLISRRNSITHGSPPTRASRSDTSELHQYVHESFALALRVYRTANAVQVEGAV